ncbi:MAG TPA: serine hydrolase domain-containing protein [Gemmatimonadales bacterium]|nr:serine hydrolase domain-containing protein [Gemmatimonadales bacterium]
MPRRIGWVAVLALLASSPLEAQRRSDPGPGWSEFTRTFRVFLATDSVVGASALLLGDGQRLAHVEAGSADRDLRQRIDERTIYHYASITKTLTAVAIMQLRDRHRLSLDDRVTSYIPELRQIHNPFGSMDAITIRMLLSHTAGFQDPTWPYRAGKPWEPFEPTRWEQLVAMMPYQEIAFPPGSRFSYSNPAFIYLARIIEAVTGDPYPTYIQKNIWTPLGLTRSYFGATPYHLADQRSNNYTLVRDSTGREAVVANGRDFDPGVTIPNSGWNAPLADLATWADFLTGAPRGDSAAARRYQGVLARTSLLEMWRAVRPITGDSAGRKAVGLSFFLFDDGGAPLVGHTGDQAGFRSFLYLNPRTGAAILGVINTGNDVDPEGTAARWNEMNRAARAVIAP